MKILKENNIKLKLNPKLPIFDEFIEALNDSAEILKEYTRQAEEVTNPISKLKDYFFESNPILSTLVGIVGARALTIACGSVNEFIAEFLDRVDEDPGLVFKDYFREINKFPTLFYKLYIPALAAAEYGGLLQELYELLILYIKENNIIIDTERMHRDMKL